MDEEENFDISSGNSIGKNGPQKGDFKVFKQSTLKFG
jgi:hypothetical protein